MVSLELKTAIIKIKNLIFYFNIILYAAKGRISTLKYRSVESIQAEA